MTMMMDLPRIENVQLNFQPKRTGNQSKKKKHLTIHMNAADRVRNENRFSINLLEYNIGYLQKTSYTSPVN